MCVSVFEDERQGRQLERAMAGGAHPPEQHRNGKGVQVTLEMECRTDAPLILILTLVLILFLILIVIIVLILIVILVLILIVILVLILIIILIRGASLTQTVSCLANLYLARWLLIAEYNIMLCVTLQ